MAAASLASIMRDQIALSVSCLDRLYLNGYVPTLQSPGQLVRFCREHLGKAIASAALFRPLHDRFVNADTRPSESVRPELFLTPGILTIDALAAPLSSLPLVGPD